MGIEPRRSRSDAGHSPQRDRNPPRWQSNQLEPGSMKCPVCEGTGGIPTCPTCRKSYIEMTPTPRTDAHQSACLRSGGRSCEGGRNAYWLARQLERENVQMLEALKGVLSAWGGHMRDDDCGCADCEYLRPVVAAIAAASLHNASAMAPATLEPGFKKDVVAG